MRQVNKPAFKRLAAIGLLFTVFTSSVVMNGVFYQMGREYFLELNKVRLDPLGVGVYAHEPIKPREPNERRVVFFGDSRALMWATPKAPAGIHFINRGVGQQTTLQALGRFEQEIPALQPDIVVIELGVNDLKAIPLFPDRRREIVESAQKNIRTIVGRVHDLGATVVLVKVFPLGPVPLTRRPFWSGDVAEAIGQVNRYITSLTDGRTLVLSADQVLLDDSGKYRDGFALDMLHLTPRAYETVNEQQLIPLLKSLR